MTLRGSTAIQPRISDDTGYGRVGWQVACPRSRGRKGGGTPGVRCHRRTPSSPRIVGAPCDDGVMRARESRFHYRIPLRVRAGVQIRGWLAHPAWSARSLRARVAAAVVVGRDRRVGRWFWKAEAGRHRWSVGLRPLAPGNMLRLNRQPLFAEVMLGRCVVLCHARLGRAGNAGAA
jgi:hypothetical protein